VRPLFGHFSRWRSESLGIQVRILEKMVPGFSQNQTGVPTKRKRRSLITATRPKGRKIKSGTFTRRWRGQQPVVARGLHPRSINWVDSFSTSLTPYPCTISLLVCSSPTHSARDIHRKQVTANPRQLPRKLRISPSLPRSNRVKPPKPARKLQPPKSIGLCTSSVSCQKRQLLLLRVPL